MQPRGIVSHIASQFYVFHSTPKPAAQMAEPIFDKNKELLIDASKGDGAHGLDGESEDIKVVKIAAQEFIDSLSNPTLHTASLLVAGY